MKHILLIVALFSLYSCEPRSDSKVSNLDKDNKRPLKVFNEEDVAKYTIAILTNKPEENFEVQKGGAGILVVDQSADRLEQKYLVKIGAYGLVLCKDSIGEWTDRIKGRRIFYYEQDDKLILSEVYEGDSTTYHEFIK
jgi:hypothetical protein